MKFGVKLIIIAFLALSVGVAFASPLLYENLVVRPFRRIPQGPTADFGVDVVYANFEVQEPIDSETSGVSSLPQISYQVVLNITNYSDIAAKLGLVNFAAAQNITLLKGALEGATASSSGGGSSGGHFGTVIEGIWLDNEWLNVTWIPGVHPEGLGEVMSSPWGSGVVVRYVGAMPTVIPSLPANASETGYWMEGVPIKQYYFFNSSASTLQLWDTIYVNGTWVNVTGRIRIEHPVTSVLEFGTIIQATTNFAPRNAFNGNQPPDETIGPRVRSTVWSGEGDFNSTWAPQQSRLIELTGTVTVGSIDILNGFTAGKLNVYAAAINYIYDKPVNGTFYDTSSLTTQLKSISLEKTADGNYLYNSILGENQMFQPDQFGVELFIKDRS
jgi:hypothetical protein